LRRGLGDPHERQVFVALDAVARRVRHAEPLHGIGAALAGGLVDPVDGGGGVVQHEQVLAELVLRSHVAGVGLQHGLQVLRAQGERHVVVHAVPGEHDAALGSSGRRRTSVEEMRRHQVRRLQVEMMTSASRLIARAQYETI
jgi:hypothetical protein